MSTGEYKFRAYIQDLPDTWWVIGSDKSGDSDELGFKLDEIVYFKAYNAEELSRNICVNLLLLLTMRKLKKLGRVQIKCRDGKKRKHTLIETPSNL